MKRGSTECSGVVPEAYPSAVHFCRGVVQSVGPRVLTPKTPVRVWPPQPVPLGSSTASSSFIRKRVAVRIRPERPSFSCGCSSFSRARRCQRRGGGGRDHQPLHFVLTVSHWRTTRGSRAFAERPRKPFESVASPPAARSSREGPANGKRAGVTLVAWTYPAARSSRASSPRSPQHRPHPYSKLPLREHVPRWCYPSTRIRSRRSSGTAGIG